VYQNITPFQILEHLNNRWCPLDVKAKKALKNTYYTKWDGSEHLTTFGKRLNDDQCALVRSNVTIADEDTLQFYLEQMYDSNHFEKSEMLDWEKKPTIIKTNYDDTKDYFEALVKATNTYVQNAGGGTAGRNKYESANNMADIGDGIREYITNLASTAADGATQEQAANTMSKTNQFDAMAAQIKALTDTVAKLVASKENIDVNADGGGEKKRDRKSRHPQATKLRNMGAYCHSHGFHPVGADHNSTTCSWKKAEHKTDATWGNRLGGDMYWPTAKRVAIEQQEHPTWKGKAAPTI